MRKIKEVLRLRHELGLAQRQIARSCSISRAAVAEYLERAEAAGLSWPLPEGCSEEQLEAQLFRRPAPEPALKRAVPDFAQLHDELQRHKHVTLQLLWQE
jgi:transposase